MPSPADETKTQYADSRKLAARARLYDGAVSEIDWFVWVARNLPLTPGARVLEVGCGPGWLWERAEAELPFGIELTLTDASAGMVAEAMARVAGLPFARLEGLPALATALPFEDGAFDLVIAMHMLYHLENPAAGIAEMHRVLRPGGLLAVTTIGENNLSALRDVARALGPAPDAGAAPAAVFGFAQAQRMMADQFGDATLLRPPPSSLRLTDPEVIFDALTSYPPGETATEAQRSALKASIARAFDAGGGVLEAVNEVGLVLSRKGCGESV